MTNVPSYGTNAVAQYTFALLLELCHQVGLHDRAVHEGQWVHSPVFSFWLTPQMELAGKTMGIIGLGRIGMTTAKLAEAFGMDVLAYTRTEKKGIRCVPLDTLLERADVISLHCPLLPETNQLICRETIGKMKDGVILLNTSRGGLVNEGDLAEALKSGKLRGAAVDVVAQEPNGARQPPADSPQLHHHASHGLGTRGKPSTADGLRRGESAGVFKRVCGKLRKLNIAPFTEPQPPFLGGQGGASRHVQFLISRPTESTYLYPFYQKAG